MNAPQITTTYFSLARLEEEEDWSKVSYGGRLIGILMYRYDERSIYIHIDVVITCRIRISWETEVSKDERKMKYVDPPSILRGHHAFMYNFATSALRKWAWDQLPVWILLWRRWKIKSMDWLTSWLYKQSREIKVRAVIGPSSSSRMTWSRVSFICYHLFAFLVLKQNKLCV